MYKNLNDTTSNYFLLSLLVLTCFLHLPSSEYVSMIKRLRRKLLCMYKNAYAHFTTQQTRSPLYKVNNQIVPGSGTVLLLWNRRC